MIPLVTPRQMEALDRYTIEELGVPGATLMENAGVATTEALLERFPEEAGKGVTVVAGKGNNGGDGLVAAWTLFDRGYDVEVVLLAGPETISGDSSYHLGKARERNIPIRIVAGGENPLSEPALIVDGILGTGLSDEVRGVGREAIGWVNGSGAKVVAIDLPSGISGETGRICGAAVEADLTVTFAYRKRGHLIQPGASLCGELVLADIGIPMGEADKVNCELYVTEPWDYAKRLYRPVDGHKGLYGHVAVIGGVAGKTGASALAAMGALRAGAGLVTLVHIKGALPVGGLLPEVMTHAVGEAGETGWSASAAEELGEELARFDAIVVGPGLGKDDGGRTVLEKVLSAGPPVVADADALTLSAQNPCIISVVGDRVVATPHPGEAARLLGTDASTVQGDRVAAAVELAGLLGCAVALKGAGTLGTALGEKVMFCPTGNSGMATAGMGDVLAGVCGALLARGLSPVETAAVGPYVHGLAGDMAANNVGRTGLLASDAAFFLSRAMDTLVDAENNL